MTKRNKETLRTGFTTGAAAAAAANAALQLLHEAYVATIGSSLLSLSLPVLAAWTQAATGDPGFAEKVRRANTARQAFGYIQETCPEVLAHVGKRGLASTRQFAGGSADVGCVVFDYTGNAVFEQEASSE